jgi:hypothetical protein
VSAGVTALHNFEISQSADKNQSGFKGKSDLIILIVPTLRRGNVVFDTQRHYTYYYIDPAVPALPPADVAVNYCQQFKNVDVTMYLHYNYLIFILEE